MKNLLKLLCTCLFIGCFFMFLSCSDDDPGADPGDPNDFCDIEVCSTNANFKQVCIDEYNDCVALGGDKETCAAAATETCTL
jgi:hypothetical protein